MSKKIIITLGKDGSVKGEVFGVKGKGCLGDVEFLNELYGAATEVEEKASMYEEGEEKLADGLPSGWCG